MKQRIKHNLSGANSVFQKVIDYYHSYYGGKASATNKCRPPSSLLLSLTITKWAISSNASSTPPILVGLQYGPRLCSVNLFILNVCHHFRIRLMIQFIILLFHRHNWTVILPHLDHLCGFILKHLIVGRCQLCHCCLCHFCCRHCRCHCCQRLCCRVVGKVHVAICKYKAVVANVFCWPANLQLRILPLPLHVVCQIRNVAMVTGLTINNAINNECSVWLAPYLVAKGMHVPLVTVSLSHWNWEVHHVNLFFAIGMALYTTIRQCCHNFSGSDLAKFE